MVRRLSLILFLALLSVSSRNRAHSLARELSTTPTSLTSVFEDSFESDSGWTMFEEIVADNPCYDDGIGLIARSTDVAYDGVYSLLVWANEARSNKSNHVIAYKNYSDQRQIGIWRYQVHVYIAPETFNSGQTGPEFSMQNTRETAPGQFRTATAGIQYIANPASAEHGQWNVWREEEPNVAGWHPFMTQTLAASTWYTLTLEADYSNNVYRSFSLQPEGGPVQPEDLSSYHIAEEIKFTEEAFVITLEAENLWNNCGAAGVFDYKVYYDLVTLENNLKSAFLPAVLK